jgi:hypothetical protein
MGNRMKITGLEILGSVLLVIAGVDLRDAWARPIVAGAVGFVLIGWANAIAIRAGRDQAQRPSYKLTRHAARHVTDRGFTLIDVEAALHDPSAVIYRRDDCDVITDGVSEVVTVRRTDNGSGGEPASE